MFRNVSDSGHFTWPMLARSRSRWSRLALPTRTLEGTNALQSRRLSYTSVVRDSKERWKLPARPARTRFAPSPTGFLHLGSLRTALFNYLLAQKTGGQFILRLEDTDKKRAVEGAEESLYFDLKWAGLQWDEGPQVGGPFGPYKQSERTHLYQAHAQKLLSTPHAYRCFCSSKRLAQLAQDRRRLGLPTDYDRQCASIPREESDFRAANGESHVVRLRAPEKYPVFTDIVYGIVGRHDTGPNVGVTHKHGEIAYEDPVLLKSDGEPTYHLANVVDDHHMEITHVIRATEWLSSTPKHLALYDAFGWKPPEFCHVGLLVDEKGRKLSKRNVDVDLASFRKKGYFKDALVNFTALLGRSIPRRSEVVDMRELIGSFDQLKFTKGDQTVTLDKLDFLSRAHLERLLKLDHIPPEVDAIIDSILEACDAGSNRTVPDPMKADERGYVLKLLRMDPRNFKSSTQFFQRNKYLLVKPDQMGPRKSGLPLEPGSASRFDIDSVQTFFESELEVTGVGSHILRSLQHSLALFYVFVQQAQPTEHKQGEKASDIHWNAKDISNQLQAISVLESRYLDSLLKQSSSPLGPRELVPHLRRTVYPHMCKFLRLGLMRGHEGPGVAEAMELIGWEETTWRVRDLINALELYCYPKTGWPSTSHEEMLTFVEVGKRELKFPDTE